ncbi:nucleotidyltransferase domain-containing protein [Sulfurihydrogenibium sp.]|uniref:nucleotidyltransferase domain-containing protein n=1 Tax=Sulfurihydrogenibium sp. TaxID=2053621 RepID=UPI00260E3DFC|nr:nucleotidyltransferase domain-containing protein [Sulfurihydrogenibium sp.]
MNLLRLSEEEIKSIKNIARKIFGEDCKIWIFGSRTNPDLKGGDIDIYIEVKDYIIYQILDKKIQFLLELKDSIGEQKIDVIIKPLGFDEEFGLNIKKSGVLL